jgi:hypothetical protein
MYDYAVAMTFVLLPMVLFTLGLTSWQQIRTRNTESVVYHLVYHLVGGAEATSEIGSHESTKLMDFGISGILLSTSKYI